MIETIKFLKSRRIELGISQAQLAQYIGFKHRSSVHRLETGQLEWKFRDILRACKLLKLNLTIEKQ